jgi:serine/threonine protein kinase
LNDELKFDQDEFTKNGRESIMLFSSVINQKTKKLNLEDFEIVSVLGKGTFGKVYLTILKETQEMFAIKAIRKDVLIETDQIESTKLERDILLKCQHPFLVGMDFVF